MRTSRSLIILFISGLVAATTISLKARQESTEKTPPTAVVKPSGTRFASAIVKLTVDPDIIVLNPDTVESLVYSAVVARDATALLGLEATADLHPFLRVEWLSQDSERLDGPPARPSSATKPQSSQEYDKEMMKRYDEEMRRQMEQLYGEEYRKQFLEQPGAEKQEELGGRAGRASPVEGGAARGMNDRRRSSPYGERTGGETGQRVEQTAFVRLTIDLPEDVTPAATEFLNVIVENLRATVIDAYEKHAKELASRLAFAESRWKGAEERLERIVGGDSPGQMRVIEQLEAMVDLSRLTPEMPVREAVEVLRTSVEPPLPIVVLWRDLEENAQIQPDSPIQLDGLPNVKLKTALEVLLKALGAGHTKVSYWIGDNVVIVGTGQTPGVPEQLISVPSAETDRQALAAQRVELARTAQNLELELAGQEARRKAILEQIETTRRQIDERVASDQVRGELERVLERAVQALSQEEGKFAPQNPALQSEAIRELKERVARAKIEVARRREEVGKSLGGQRLEEFNTELSRMAIDRAEKQAQMNILQIQLRDVQQQLAEASTFDPVAARMRVAREAFDLAARQVAAWQARLTSLPPPTVTLIGVN